MATARYILEYTPALIIRVGCTFSALKIFVLLVCWVSIDENW